MDMDTEEHQNNTSQPFEICRRGKDNSVLNGTHDHPGDNVYVAKTSFKTIAFSKNLQHSFWHGKPGTFMYYTKVVFTYPRAESPRLFSLSRFHRQLSARRLQRRPQRRPVRIRTENKKNSNKTNDIINIEL